MEPNPLSIYRGDYEEFIERIKSNRPLNEHFKYSENHHIIPKCIGGTDDPENLIYLTYREHFIAHKILAEENPENKKLVYAYWRTCNGNASLTPEEYEIAKKLYADMRRSIPSPLRGRKYSAEFCKHVAENHADFSGVNHPMYGKHHTEESKENMREGHRGIDYHLVCKICGKDFIGHASRIKYCESCRGVVQH